MAERTCIEPGCTEPAGTHHSPLWCAKHDEERIERITASMEAISAKFKGGVVATPSVDHAWDHDSRFGEDETGGEGG